MKKIKSLSLFQKAILVMVIIMVSVFAVVYPLTISKTGIEYKNSIFVPSQEDNATVYRGKFHGERAQILVGEDNSVVFQCGESSYGPYFVTVDPTALPEDPALNMVGVEIREGEKLLFRGGVQDYSGMYSFVKEDGSSSVDPMGLYNSDSLTYEEREKETFEPSNGIIYRVVCEPELTHKGEWFGLGLGLFLCATIAASVIFADNMFRRETSIWLRNAENVEPSERAIARRNISWFGLVIFTLAVFILGLK